MAGNCSASSQSGRFSTSVRTRVDVTTDPVEIVTSMLPAFASRSSLIVPMASVKKPRCSDMFMCRTSNIGVVCEPSIV